jgi:hypothetical protein
MLAFRAPNDQPDAGGGSGGPASDFIGLFAGRLIFEHRTS